MNERQELREYIWNNFELTELKIPKGGTKAVKTALKYHKKLVKRMTSQYKKAASKKGIERYLSSAGATEKQAGLALKHLAKKKKFIAKAIKSSPKAAESKIATKVTRGMWRRGYR